MEGEHRVKVALVWEPGDDWDVRADLYVENDRGVYRREEGYTVDRASTFYPWDAVKSVTRYYGAGA